MEICVASCPSLLLRPGEVRRRFVALHVGLLKNERREFCGCRRRVLGGRGPVPPLDAPLRALPARRPAGTSDRSLPRTTSRRIPGRCSPPALRRRIRAKPRSSPPLAEGEAGGAAPGPRMLALTAAGRAVWAPWKPALSPGDALAGYPDQQVLRGQGEVVAAAEAHFGLNLENTLGREPSTDGEGDGGGVWRGSPPRPRAGPAPGTPPRSGSSPRGPRPSRRTRPRAGSSPGRPRPRAGASPLPHVLRGLSPRPLSAGGWAADGAVGGAGWGPFSPPPFGWGAEEGWVVINNRGAGARGGARAENGAGGTLVGGGLAAAPAPLLPGAATPGPRAPGLRPPAPRPCGRAPAPEPRRRASASGRARFPSRRADLSPGSSPAVLGMRLR
ncbi:hypothetical protein J1605_010888 [Eschrichtius robustus]|uniref:Uncharacterized protein n=1 Tax=Eschrichtius robustus TaxID=9764 RepID=A0AB34GSN6_ESCRO|nr:hypothetical protein J1605_010888 [Eschrichtius robustus]